MMRGLDFRSASPLALDPANWVQPSSWPSLATVPPGSENVLGLQRYAAPSWGSSPAWAPTIMPADQAAQVGSDVPFSTAPDYKDDGLPLPSEADLMLGS